MENIMQNLQSWLSMLFDKNSLAVFNKSIQPYMLELKAFHFSYLNPVFIALILVSLLALSRFWGIKKSFTYCLAVSLILILTTALSSHVNIPLGESVLTSTDLINGAAIVIIAIVTLFYIFIKN
jgi:hypothetical protein